MNPFQIPGPIPAAVQAEIRQHLQAAFALLKDYNIELSAADRKDLGRTGLGPESLPFATTARLLMEKHPDILPRSITTDDITTYGQRLDTVIVCQSIKADTMAIYAIANNLDIAAGSGLMGTARTAYNYGQQDKGRTPGVEPLVGEMSERYKQEKDDDDQTPPKA